MRLQSRFATVCVAAALGLVVAAEPAVAQTTITTSTTVSGTVSYAGLTVGGVSPGPTLTINAPAAITVTASPSFIVGSNANPYATVIQNGGSLVTSSTVNSQLYLGQNLSAGNTAYTGSASYTLNAGTITLGGTAATTGILGIGRSSDATFTQNGGSITAYRNDTVLFIASGGNGSSYTLTGGTFEGIGTTGPSNGGLGIASNANVSSSGTLTINGAGATVAVQPGNANLTTNGGTATVNLLNGTLALNGEVTRGTPNSTRTPGTVSFTLGGGTLRPYSTNLVVGSSTAANTAAFDITLAANSLSTITGVGWKSGTSTVTIVSNIVGSGSIQFTGGTVVLSGANTYSGATTVNSGTLAIGAGGTTGSITGNVANNATLVFNRSNSITYSGTISGSGDILKQGAGQLTLSASNSFTGNTTVNSGTLLLGNQNALRGSTFAGGGGTLAFTNVSDPISNFYYLGGLSGSSSFSLLDTSGTSIRLNFGFNNADTTFSGNLTNGQGIEKYGTGTTTLSGNISTGTAFGQLSVGQGGLRQTGGTITLNRNNGSGAFTVGVGSGTTGSYVLQSGTLLVSSTLGHVRLGGNGGTGMLTIDGGSARAFFSGTNNTIGGNDLNATSGTGTINLIAGELAVNSLTTGTVAGATGNFNFAGGTLRPYSQNASIGRSGSGFSIALAGSSATFSGLDAAAGTARTLTVLTALVDGTAGAAGAIFSGGTISLSAASTYSGATTIAGTNSTLALGANGSFANSPTITVGNAGSSGAILDLTAKTGTFTFTSGQTVGGIGRLNIGSGKTIASQGIWAPGNSIGSNAVTGNLALTGTSQFELGTPGTSTSAPGSSDFTAVSGTLTLGGALALLDNAGANGLGSAAGGVYRLFTYGSAVSGSYASVTTNPTPTTRTSLGNISYGGSGTAAGNGVFLSIYNLAAANIASGTTVNFGSVLKGTSLSQALTISNTAPGGSYSEKLGAAFGSSTGQAGGSGSWSLLSAGGTSTALSATLASGSAGVASGSQTLNFTSDGDGTSGLAATSIGSQTVNLTATVLDPALASFASGSTATTSLVLSFGSINQGDSISPLGFSLFNLLQTAGYTADLALLQIDETNPGGPLSTNLSLFNSLASGTFNAWQASVDTANQGTFSNTWTLQFKSSNGGTVYGGDTSQTLTLTTSVIVVPEPGAIALAGIGIAAAAWALRRPRSRR